MRFLANWSSWVGLISLILHVLVDEIDDLADLVQSIIWLTCLTLTLLNDLVVLQVNRVVSCADVELAVSQRYSSQLQLRSDPYLLVRPSVCVLVDKIPGEPHLGFLSFFAWMFTTIRTRNVHGGFPGKNLDHSIITIQCQKQPFFNFERILTKI